MTPDRIIWVFFCTSHGPVRLPHILLSEDEADEADASVHQPHQEAGQGEDLIAGSEGGHVTEDHLEEQTWREEKEKDGMMRRDKILTQSSKFDIFNVVFVSLHAARG